MQLLAPCRGYILHCIQHVDSTAIYWFLMIRLGKSPFWRHAAHMTYGNSYTKPQNTVSAEILWLFNKTRGTNFYLNRLTIHINIANLLWPPRHKLSGHI